MFQWTKISTACTVAQTLCRSTACSGASFAVHWNVLYERSDNASDLQNGTSPPPVLQSFSTLHNGYWATFPGESSQDIALTTHPPTSAEFKEGAELYLCPPTGSTRPVVGRCLSLPFCGTMR
jgi:hypothetical protein